MHIVDICENYSGEQIQASFVGILNLKLSRIKLHISEPSIFFRNFLRINWHYSLLSLIVRKEK